MQSYLHRLSVFVWSGENDSNTLRVKKSKFSKIAGYVWTRPNTAEALFTRREGNPSARVTLPVTFACKPELALTRLLG